MDNITLALIKAIAGNSGGGSVTPGKDGVGISKIEKTDTQGLVDTYTISYTNGTTTTFTVTNGQNGADGAPGTNGQDGSPGEDGFSPTIVENENNDESTYKLDIATKTGSFTTPNLKGDGGAGTTDYSDLSNKPKINEVELTGNKTLSDLSIQSTSDNTLNTTDKTIVGAINELYSMITSISQKIDEVNGEVV